MPAVRLDLAPQRDQEIAAVGRFLAGPFIIVVDAFQEAGVDMEIRLPDLPGFRTIVEISPGQIAKRFRCRGNEPLGSLRRPSLGNSG